MMVRVVEILNNHQVGAWRSLVAYLNGVQRVGGSNPLAPTNKIKQLATRHSASLLNPSFF